jgi:ribosomal protein S18 acetylase RimI-like enzyme
MEESIAVNISRAQFYSTSFEANHNRVIVQNTLNPGHHMGNLCTKIRAPSMEQFELIVDEVIQRFQVAPPRIYVDQNSTPEMATLEKYLASKNFAIEHDTDIIMSFSFTPDHPLRWDNWKSSTISDKLEIRAATMEDLEELIVIISEAFKFTDTVWLENKLKTQLLHPNLFPTNIAILKEENEDPIAAATTILWFPPTLPHLGHVGTVATRPNFQKRGFAAACLRENLKWNAKEGIRIYLEVDPENEHAKRLYQRLGFEVDGECKFFLAVKEGEVQ